jgi:hypothetical protein
MTNNKSLTKSEVLAIIETYEGLILQDFSNMALRAAWTEWKDVLARLGQ